MVQPPEMRLSAVMAASEVKVQRLSKSKVCRVTGSTQLREACDV